MRCIDCDSDNVIGPDFEGVVDCFDCGAAWIPGVAIDTNGESNG